MRAAERRLAATVVVLNALVLSAGCDCAGSASDDGVQRAYRPLGPEFCREKIPVEDGHLSYLYRPGTGPALILIPGTFSDHRVYTKTVRHLDPDLRLLIIENRGLGASWPPPENGSIEQCARDAMRVADQLDVEAFYIGGHSLGGMIAMEVGRRAVDRVRGVISIEGWTSWHAARDAFGHDMKSTLTDEQLATKAAYRKQVLERWREDQVEAFGRIWRQWDGSAFLEQTHLPVLSMWGDRGRARPAQDKLRVPRRDNIQIVWFENTSHALLLQRPREVAEAINQFIARRPAAQTGRFDGKLRPTVTATQWRFWAAWAHSNRWVERRLGPGGQDGTGEPAGVVGVEGPLGGRVPIGGGCGWSVEGG